MGGTPAYQTLDLRAGVQLFSDVNVYMAVQNLTNRTYRVHGSGVTAAGTNVSLTTEIIF